MHSSSSIDLAKKQTSLPDEIIKWALSFGRLLIIVVEIVAFTAFIGRFWLDRELVDLNDKIQGQQEIVNSFSEQEKEFRNLHERLATVKKVDTEGNKALMILNDIAKFTPQDITYNSFILEKDELTIEVNVTKIPPFTEYFKSLQEYKQLNSIAITGIENSSGANSVKITIQANVKTNSIGEAKE